MKAIPRVSEPGFWAEWYARMPRTLGVYNSNFIVGGGSQVVDYRPMLLCSANDAAVASIAEAVSYYQLGPGNDFWRDLVNGRHEFSMPWIVSAFMRSVVRDAAAGSFYGIELGSFNVGIPFPAPSATRSLVQLRVNEDPANYRFELLVNNSTGAGTQTILADVAGRVPAVNVPYHALIEYMPGQYVRGYIDGVLVAEDTTVLLEQTVSGRYGLCCFAACITPGVFESAYFAGMVEHSWYGI